MHGSFMSTLVMLRRDTCCLESKEVNNLRTLCSMPAMRLPAIGSKVLWWRLRPMNDWFKEGRKYM